MWKRHQNKLAYQWNVQSFEPVDEPPRPEFLALLGRKNVNKAENPITKVRRLCDVNLNKSGTAYYHFLISLLILSSQRLKDLKLFSYLFRYLGRHMHAKKQRQSSAMIGHSSKTTSTLLNTK